MPRRSELRITKRTVDALTVGEKDTVFWDRDLAGLGVRVHATGRKTYVVYPTTTALLAAHYAPALPVPYLSFGGFSATSGLTRFTRIDDANLLRDIASPASRVFSDEDWAALESYRNVTAERLETTPNLLPGDVRHRAFHRSAFATEGLKVYADAIPPEDELEQEEEYAGRDGRFYSNLRRQAQLTVLAFKTGVAVSADLWLGGFDTHADHDPDHEWMLGNLTDSVDFLWEYAEEHGVADRMVVVMGSDFGRTNFYNARSGKDHWPIGSFVIMEKGQRWTGHAVGKTDGLHFAQRINPRTLRGDDRNGTIIYRSSTTRMPRVVTTEPMEATAMTTMRAMTQPSPMPSSTDSCTTPTSST